MKKVDTSIITYADLKTSDDRWDWLFKNIICPTVKLYDPRRKQYLSERQARYRFAVLLNFKSPGTVLHHDTDDTGCYTDKVVHSYCRGSRGKTTEERLVIHRKKMLAAYGSRQAMIDGSLRDNWRAYVDDVDNK